MATNVNVLMRMCDYDGIISEVGDLDNRIMSVAVTTVNGEQFELECNDSIVTHLSIDDGYDYDVKVSKLVEVLKIDTSRDLSEAIVIKLNAIKYRIINHSCNVLLSNELTNKVDHVCTRVELEDLLNSIDKDYIVYNSN